jgi:hypothetical protein
MASTHQRISDASMEEWSFFVAQTVQQHILVREKSPLCMLPTPLNLVTAAFAPLHYSLMRQGVSLAGSIADKLLIPIGHTQSYFFLLFLFVLGIPKLVVNIFKQKKYLEVLLGLFLMVRKYLYFSDITLTSISFTSLHFLFG